TGAPSADLARSPSRLPAPTATPPLSLHDALPISPDSSDGPCSLRAGAVARLGGSTAAAERGLRAALIVTLGHWGCHPPSTPVLRSEEHTSELQSRFDLVCRLLLEQKKTRIIAGDR